MKEESLSLTQITTKNLVLLACHYRDTILTMTVVAGTDKCCCQQRFNTPMCERGPLCYSYLPKVMFCLICSSIHPFKLLKPFASLSENKEGEQGAWTIFLCKGV